MAKGEARVLLLAVPNDLGDSQEVLAVRQAQARQESAPGGIRCCEEPFFSVVAGSERSFEYSSHARSCFSHVTVCVHVYLWTCNISASINECVRVGARACPHGGRARACKRPRVLVHACFDLRKVELIVR